MFIVPHPLCRQMKWHEACLSISAAILEILNAWENGVLAFESIQVASPLLELLLSETQGQSLRAVILHANQSSTINNRDRVLVLVLECFS